MIELVAILRDRVPEAVLAHHAQHGDETVVVAPESLVRVFECLREEPELAFDMLMDLTAVDHSERADGPGDPRFEVVYHLYASTHGHRLRVKVGVAEEACELDSLAPAWPAADWMEREVFDLYGIRFRGHPDLRRILLYDGFEGHPLRKDYPKTRRQPLVGPCDS